jgi:alanine racemase
MLSQERLTGLRECERAWVEVDLEALIHNTHQLKALLAPETAFMAVIKADAYGHGAVTVAQTVLAHGVDWLGVATLPEGIQLRREGITAPILVLGSINTPAEVRAMAKWDLHPSLSSPKQALTFSRHLPAPHSVHLMLDTGMGRLGCDWQDGLELLKFIQGLPNLKLAGIYSHLSMADHPDPSFTLEQQQCFEYVIQQARAEGIRLPHLHLANSAATLRHPELHYDMVRVGLALYGLYPAPHLRPYIDLQPVLQVRARITLVKTIKAGTGISYGHQFIAPTDMKIAVVGIGYADGIPRRLSNRMQVLVQGQKVYQIGAITMDQLMIDVTNIPDIQPGEIVTLLGEDGDERICAEDWAVPLETISWEILCGFKHRLPRVTTI